MKLDPATGPIPRAEFAALVDLPFGEARERIQRYDPLWGRSSGDLIKWDVRFTREVCNEGFATVEAATEEDAERLADILPEDQICWGDGDDFCDITLESVTPRTGRRP